MNMNSFWGKQKLLNSIEATKGGERLLEKIDNGMLTMETLPNQYDKFTGPMEENDYVSYCRFIQSSNGKKVLEMLEKDDARQYVEL